jgi:putative glutathione S-transferase
MQQSEKPTFALPIDAQGKFVRKDAGFRNQISPDSEHFQPESGRYHLYVSYSCPWAHRTIIMRSLKGLQDHIGLSVVHPTWQYTKPGQDEHTGWVFKKEGDAPLKSINGFGSFPCKGVIPDTVNNAQSVRELYELSNDTAKTYSVPVLWDKKEKVIVNNESSEIIRIFNSAFNEFSKHPELDFYPENLRGEIDKVNDWIYHDFNNGVYKAGFAKSQEAYEEAVTKVFNALDRAEEILSKSRYLVGNQLTEADIRFFVSLVRFDEAYAVYFKCNKKRIVDYPNVLNYTRDLYQTPGVGETVKMDHIKLSYYTSHPALNNYAIVPVGPDFEGTLKEKHDRNRFNSK